MEEKLVAHPFARTLGPGPYRFVGTFDLGAALAALNAGNVEGYNSALRAAPRVEAGMGTCAHCCTPITFICLVRTGEGKLYGVGSDCIYKVGLPVHELASGKKVIPYGEACEGFDYQTGCPGHPSEEEKADEN